MCQAICSNRSSLAKAADLSAAAVDRSLRLNPAAVAAALMTAQVHLCGSFTRWVETVPMQPVEGQPGTFAVVVHLPPG